MGAWQILDNPTTEQLSDAAFNRQTRILVDESLGVGVAQLLKDLGYNALFAGDVGLAGHSDEDVMSYAWRDDRMLWTHDHDFLDDKRFPEHRNPGLVVLPGAAGDQIAMERGIVTAIKIFGSGQFYWRRTKTIVFPNGDLALRCRNSSTGAITETRYRLCRNGSVLVLED